ncbi:hypothetical protein GUJ93_ZPchr0006g42484 [Zizania palustris]|uniref:Uncharacterized protein n=1 Tax=Zizania palustris TaxID=103762 RepID=A0A8J5VVB9_ZIZPA|nr:hypothetical protein GUJ93_ZPchr0006g42484 [Zizania palustris]
MDGGYIAGGSSEARRADGPSSSGSSVSSYGSVYRLQKAVHLRRWRRRRRLLLARGGDRKGAADGAQDLALPLGMSFAAVLAQVMNKSSCSGERLQPDFLSKMCTSAVKESLTNIYGDKFNFFIKNFEKSFVSTLRTLCLINETPVYNQDTPQCSHKDGTSDAEIKLSGANSESLVHDIQENTSFSFMDNQIILHAGVNQQLVHLPRNKSSPEFDRHILNVFERSLNEQTRSNELKELEIGLNMRKLQLKQSQIALSSYSHMLEKIKITMGFQKASFREDKFRTQMEDTRHAELLKRLIDMLLTAVLARQLQGSPNLGGCQIQYQHSIRRSTMTGPNMPITFNVMILGVLCGFVGRFCVDTLGGDGNVWLIFWEALCFIHLLGNSWPSLLYRVLYGPISVTDRAKAVGLPYWIRRWNNTIFNAESVYQTNLLSSKQKIYGSDFLPFGNSVPLYTVIKCEALFSTAIRKELLRQGAARHQVICVGLHVYRLHRRHQESRHLRLD